MRTGLALILTVAGVAMVAEPDAYWQAHDPLRGIAERYVKLVLAVGQHDPDYVDAFYGPAEWREASKATHTPLGELAQEAAALETELNAAPAVPADTSDGELWALRLQYLHRQLQSLRARIAMLQGQRLTFDDESRALYDAVAPGHTEADFEPMLKELDARLPSGGTLIERLDRFRESFIVPIARLDAVFQAAIHACRDRTLAHVELPPEESFTVEYVTGKPWGGYNWYQGNYRSLIQVNTDLPVYVDRAIDLACHEGYPGHHVYNVLLEQHLVRQRGWVEFTVYPLFSPQSLIAEGTANYGIDVAFSPDERLVFERDVLFPLAGLDPARAKAYDEIRELRDRLAYADNEAARRYLDGAIDAKAAADWLERHAVPRAFAEKRVKFYDQYRSYVINYNLGKDLVRAFVERRAGREATAERKWREFAALLSSPRLPSGLK